VDLLEEGKVQEEGDKELCHPAIGLIWINIPFSSSIALILKVMKIRIQNMGILYYVIIYIQFLRDLLGFFA
jgi:hypothetical protein